MKMMIYWTRYNWSPIQWFNNQHTTRLYWHYFYNQKTKTNTSTEMFKTKTQEPELCLFPVLSCSLGDATQSVMWQPQVSHTVSDEPVSSNDDDDAGVCGCRLCEHDADELFERLESQVREVVIEMKVRLLKELTMDHKVEPRAHQFVALLLTEYCELCASSQRAAFLHVFVRWAVCLLSVYICVL